MSEDENEDEFRHEFLNPLSSDAGTMSADLLRDDGEEGLLVIDDDNLALSTRNLFSDSDGNAFTLEEYSDPDHEFWNPLNSDLDDSVFSEVGALDDEVSSEEVLSALDNVVDGSEEMESAPCGESSGADFVRSESGVHDEDASDGRDWMALQDCVDSGE
jgi:hypothetical protein